MWPGILSSISVHSSCSWEIFYQLSVQPGALSSTFSIFRAAGDLLSNFINFAYRRDPFLQILLTFHEARRLSITFLFGWETFHPLLSTFDAAERSSVHFHQLSVWLGVFLCSLSTFCVAGSPSDNIHELSVCPCNLP